MDFLSNAWKERGKAALEGMPSALAQGLLRKLYPSQARRFRGMLEGQGGQPGVLEPFVRSRSIFVHITKCAGSSVATGLYGRLIGHWSLAYYRLIFPRQDFKSFFKFSFVRNPWDRLVSAFHFQKEQVNIPHPDRAWTRIHVDPFVDFEDFVLHSLPRPEVRNWLHFRPQSEFLRLAWGAKQPLDFLGRFEELEQGYRTVAARLGRPSEIPDLNRGETRKDGYRPYYTPKTRALVERYYAEDIRAFGYEY